MTAEKTMANNVERSFEELLKTRKYFGVEHSPIVICNHKQAEIIYQLCEKYGFETMSLEYMLFSLDGSERNWRPCILLGVMCEPDNEDDESFRLDTDSLQYYVDMWYNFADPKVGNCSLWGEVVVLEENGTYRMVGDEEKTKTVKDLVWKTDKEYSVGRVATTSNNSDQEVD